MRRFFLPFFTFILLSFSEMLFPQQLYTVYLDEEIDNYVNPLELEVNPGDQIRFISTGGDFQIAIPNANKILEVKGLILKIELTSGGPIRPIYTVKEVKDEIVQEYEVVNTPSGGEPDAPPKIIIRTD